MMTSWQEIKNRRYAREVLKNVQYHKDLGRIANAIAKAGGNTYIVGGAVRDSMLGIKPNDYDLLVTGVNSDETQNILEGIWGTRVEAQGKAFGVFRVRGYEIALPRREKSIGVNHVDFEVTVDHTMSVDDDLWRRDFTVNAMAVNILTGQMHDPTNGSFDVNKRVVRPIHKDTFSDDPLRFLRALVLTARYGFTLHSGIRVDALSSGHLLETVSAERVQWELDKIFEAADPATAISWAQELDLLQYVLPEVAEHWEFDQNNPHHQRILGEHLLATLEYVQRINTDKDVRLASLLHDIGKPDSAWKDPDTGMNHFYYSKTLNVGAQHEAVGAEMAEVLLLSLAYPVARVNRIKNLVLHHMWAPFTSEKGARKFLRLVGDYAEDLIDIREGDQDGKEYNNPDARRKGIPNLDVQRELVRKVREGKQPTDKSMLAVNGNDLIAWGIPKGPAIGYILNELVTEVVAEPSLNNTRNLKDLANKYYKTIPNE